MRELQAYIDPESQSLTPDTMNVEQIKEFQKCKIILADISIILNQDAHLSPMKRIEQIELREYLYKLGRIDCNGDLITNKEGKKKNKFKEIYEVHTVDYRASIKLNYTDNINIQPEYETWKDSYEYKVPLEKTNFRKGNQVFPKFRATKVVNIDRFQPHRLSALVFILEQVICIQRIVDNPEGSLEDNIIENVERVVTVATLPYIPIVDCEEKEGEDEDGIPFTNLVYTLRMVNIDYQMEINPKLSAADHLLSDNLAIYCIATLSQKVGDESVREDEDLYERELRILKENIRPVIDEKERTERERLKIIAKTREVLY